MAIEQTVSDPITVTRVDTVTAVTRIERSARAVIETPRDGSYGVLVTREIVWLDAGSNVLKSITSPTPLHRLASAIASESVTLTDGMVVTAAQVMEAVQRFFDSWAAEDVAAGRR